MKTFILSLTLFLAFTISASADDVTDVRSTIERHYAAINSQENETVYGHHLPSFTMYGADGGILWEADALETTERMKADLPWPHLQVRMANFNAQVYGDVAVATGLRRCGGRDFLPCGDCESRRKPTEGEQPG
jgi:hypothetical protein